MAGAVLVDTLPEWHGKDGGDGLLVEYPTRKHPNEEQQLLVGQLSELIVAAAGSTDFDKPFLDSGLDSLGVTRVAATLSATLGKQINPNLLFEYPTADALVRRLAAPVAEVCSSATDCALSSWDGGLRVLAEAHRLPGNATTMQQLWTDGLGSRSAITKIPSQRFDMANWQRAPRYAGFLAEEDLSKFSNEWFNISTAEARAMDPRQQLALEETARALHLARMQHSSTSSAVGVFAGASHDDFALMGPHRAGTETAFSTTGASTAVLAGRISFCFGLVGPS